MHRTHISGYSSPGTNSLQQRIGTIILDFKEDEELDIFDWCGRALAAKQSIEADLKSATSKAEWVENAVKELRDQLEELIRAKKAEEAELLGKCRDLLNEKKVKIREQQRLLLENNVDAESVGVAPSPKKKAPQTTRGHTPKSSRTSKRKAAEPEPEPEVPESDDELEKMEVDKKHGEEDSEEDRTTDAGDNDDETASEPDDEDEEPVPATRRAARNVDKPPAANTRHASQKKVETPPPPRTLPFNQRKAAAKPSPSPEPEPEAEGSETESDDEL